MSTSKVSNFRVESGESQRIRVGIGGWTYEPWRSNFYPEGLSHAKELGYASRQLTAIEVNGTYYSTFKPPTFRKWHDEVPDDFVFSLKASRYATNRKVLAEAGDSIARFVGSGITELKDKLGPIVWPFMPTKVFDAEDFEAFLALLPKQEGSRPLRHVMDVRHASFITPDYQTLAKKYQVSTVFSDADKFPSFEEPQGDLAYARLMMADAKRKTGYTPKALDAWAERAKSWTAPTRAAKEEAKAPKAAKAAPGADPAKTAKARASAASATAATGQAAKRRDVFVFFINGAKEKAPAAAGALLGRLGWKPQPEAGA